MTLRMETDLSISHTLTSRWLGVCTQRYGSLIAFSNWLLERQLEAAPGEDKNDTSDGSRVHAHRSEQRMKTFPEWLNEHREVLHILQKRSLE